MRASLTRRWNERVLIESGTTRTEVDRHATYAAAHTGFLRANSEPVVRSALNRPEGEPVTVESLYERVRARLLAEPERYLFRYILVAALLTRR